MPGSGTFPGRSTRAWVSDTFAGRDSVGEQSLSGLGEQPARTLGTRDCHLALRGDRVLGYASAASGSDSSWAAHPYPGDVR